MPTKIGKGVWIMPNVTIAPGVTIGDEVVIATGSVVTKDIPARSMVAGMPAKIIKDLKESLES
jgi:maltose O-acetyltransferase